MAARKAKAKEQSQSWAQSGSQGGKRISLEELNRKIVDPSTPPQELAQYFLRDDNESGPFDPALKLNPETVDVPATPAGRARGDVLLASANNIARLRRRMAFEARIGSGYKGPIIVSEGDSWFQYPLRLQDVIDHLSVDYAIRSLDAAGDTLQNMFEEGEYIDAIQETGASVFLFSGGGNDVLGGGNLKEHLRDFDPALSAEQHLLPSFRQLTDHAIALYDRIFRSVEDLPGDILTICHGYDRPIPNNGKWLGRPMVERGINDPGFQVAIVKVMIDRFNSKLKLLADTFSNVTYLDVRGVVGAQPSRWDDELHPTSVAYGDVAARFRAEIQQSAKPRTLAAGAKARARGRSVRRDAQERDLSPKAPAVARGGRQGISLHVGLNFVDPRHYGSEAPLAACEYDAQDMANIAGAKGFQVAGTLLSKAATRKAVISGIADAAKKLKAGDIFLFTYAGHGSQIPDFNADEEDGSDETFCLYDGMLIDDELYDLWAEFRDDVRVLVVSDSCHSGTAVRVAPPVTIDAVEQRTRLLPRSIAGRAYREHRDFYNKLGKSRYRVNEKRLLRELSEPLRCSVLLLSGCQDNQESLDGPANGRFTQELLTVWDDGQFNGDYKRFHRRILNGMPPNQSPNFWATGRPNSAFLGQKPFSI